MLVCNVCTVSAAAAWSDPDGNRLSGSRYNRCRFASEVTDQNVNFTVATARCEHWNTVPVQKLLAKPPLALSFLTSVSQ